MIDVDALEDYVRAHHEELVNSEEVLHIDVDQMMVSKKSTQVKVKNEIREANEDHY